MKATLQTRLTTLVLGGLLAAGPPAIQAQSLSESLERDLHTEQLQLLTENVRATLLEKNRRESDRQQHNRTYEVIPDYTTAGNENTDLPQRVSFPPR